MERDEAFFQERMDWYRQEMELHRRMVEAQTQHQAQMHELLMTAFKAAAAGPKAQGSVALPNLGTSQAPLQSSKLEWHTSAGPSFLRLAFPGVHA